MPDTEIRTLKTISNTLTHCPAILDNLETCGQKLKVQHEWTFVGDDYGEWTNHRVYFECGHTLEQMLSGVKNREFV